MYNGTRIKELMEHNDISGKQLVEAMGWASHRQLYQVVHGNPTVSTLEKIADILGVSIAAFFDRDNEEEVTAIYDNNGVNWDMFAALLKSKNETIRLQQKRIADLERIVQLLDDKAATGTNKTM